MSATTEAEWEAWTLEHLAELGWSTLAGADIAPGTGERESWDELHLPARMLEALRRFNSGVPVEYLRQALAEIVAPSSNDAITENKRIHDTLVGGYHGISYLDADGREHNPTIRLISTDPDANEWLVVSQVRIVKGDHRRRFDLVLYCNGMPVSIIELKKAGSATADVASAHAQLATYLREFPLAFRFVVFNLASDGVVAKYGTPFTPLNHFSPWSVDESGAVVDLDHPDENGNHQTGLELALYGLYDQERFLQLLRNFTAFDAGDALAKRIAKPHQYFAVTKAVAETVKAVKGNGKAGVVWHTQGSGKSMEMELYTAMVMRRPELHNPTVVVITDRTDLDDQLYAGFEMSRLLPESPVKITRRAELRAALADRAAGGIFFTTLQKFGRSKGEKDSGAEHPTLSTRTNIVVIVDEAHRSHYDDLDGYAKHLRDALPHATLIAFTGTPISFADRNTRETFGDYIDIYDLSRAVVDGATVPVYFEPRLIRMARREDVTDDDLDRAADDATAALDDEQRAQIERSVALVNAVYGAPERLRALAADIVAHWEARRDRMRPFIEANGKAMIVGGTREICANLYAEIVALRPGWHSDSLGAGRIKVIYSGTPSDVSPIVEHVRRDSENKALKERLRNVDDELELVIVKDMLLTGYDSPPLHTLYLDRPLQGALLMQTLARVNRTFRGKQDGLLVGYAPLADNLKKALAEYSEQDQENRPVGKNIDEAVGIVTDLVAALRELVAGHNWRADLQASGPRARVNALSGTVNFLRNPHTAGNQVEEGEPTLAETFRRLTSQLARAWALCSREAALVELQPEIAFYEEARVWMAKLDAEDRIASGQPVPDEIARLLVHLVATSTATGEVLDIYEAAGMPRPSLSDLTPSFADQASKARNPQLAIEALRNLVAKESQKATRTNAIRQRAFSERVAELMRQYTNQQLTSAEVIAELIALARETVAESNRGQRFTPPLSDDELAFYDAVAQNESAVEVQGEGVLADIARELVTVMRRDIRTDWTYRDDVKAKLRASIKRLLAKHGYPPDKRAEAIKLVLDQMETLAPRFVEDEGGETEDGG